MSNQIIEIPYRNARIIFDIHTEEWVAYMNTERVYDIGTDEFKRHASLKKLKDSIDRFNKKNFKPIPIIIFDSLSRMKTAEIISFTETSGECWIRRDDDRRELVKTIKQGFSHTTKIYACENINNEPIILEINSINEEIERMENNVYKKKAERTHLIDSLQQFDISGFVVEPDENIII